MYRTHRSWCRKFAQFTLWATLYSSWVLGLFPFIYISRTRKIERSRRLVVYGIIFNVALIWVFYKNVAATEVVGVQEIYIRNPLAEQINYIQNIIILSTLFVTYFRNWWMSEELGKILNMMLDLHHRHFIEFDTSDCKDFDNYTIYKGLIIVLELISQLSLEIPNAPSFGYKMLIGPFSLLFMQLAVFLVCMHFHLAVLFIYRSLWIINRELLRIVNLNDHGGTASTRVYELHYLYKRLLELNRRIVSIYDYQITLLLMSLLTMNIVLPFFIMVYTISLKNPVTIKVVLNFLQAMFINFIDFWLHFSVCELAMRTNEGTLRILKLFNEKPDMSTELERCVTDFALFSSHQRLKFNHFGMFDVDNALGFRMIITCVLYLVYLVQFDYMNL